MNRIKLLHVTSSLKMGGAETLLCNLLEKLPHHQFEHHVIYFHDGPLRHRIEMLGIPAYHIKGAIALFDPIFWIRLLLRVRSIKPRGIHSLLWAANVAARIVGTMLKIPVISAYHNNISTDGFVRNSADRITIGYAKKLIAVSQEVADSVKFNASRVADNDICVIKNGIDIEAVRIKSNKNAITKKELGLMSEHIIIGSVGRFHSLKNYSLLIRAFAQIYIQFPQIRLVLVGQGPQEIELRQCAQELGIKDVVFFEVGKQGYGYYPIFDVFVQSSDKEGISLALLEAMSCEVPCVVTHVNPSLHSVIKNMNNGLVVPAGNASALEQAIITVMLDEPLKQKLTTGAIGILKNQFDEKSMIMGYKTLYEQELVYPD